MSTAEETRKHILACTRIMREYYTSHGHEMWDLGVQHADRVASVASDTRCALDSGQRLSVRMLSLVRAERDLATAVAFARTEDSRNGLPYIQSINDVAIADAVTWARTLIVNDVRTLETVEHGSKPRTSRHPR